MDKLECMRYAGKVNQLAIEYGFRLAVPGTSLLKINSGIEEFILDMGCKPAFKNYHPVGSPVPFPATACLSPNDVVVHGLPNDYIIKPGDLLTVDVGCEYNGWYVDSARSRLIPCENAGRAIRVGKLITATEAILEAQLNIIKHNCTFLDLIRVSEKTAKLHDVLIMSRWGGHQIGNRIHIDPFIPSAIDRKQSPLKQGLEESKYGRQVLEAGQTICIEPVVTEGFDDTIIIEEDLWTIRKQDGLLAAHTERCLLVTETGYELIS